MIKNENKILLYGLILGCVFTYLFYNKVPGISVPIFILLLVVSSIYVLKENNRITNRYAYLWIIPIGFLSIAYFTSNNGIFMFFNFLMIVLMLTIMSVLISGKHMDKWYSINIIGSIAVAVFAPVRYFFRPVSLIGRNVFKAKNGKGSGTAKKIALGVLFSLPLLIIVVSLLSSADMVFENDLSNMSRYIEHIISSMGITDIINIIILILIVAVYYFSYILNLMSNLGKQEELVKTDVTHKSLDSTILITVLVILNIVYILFCYIQFSYLLAGGGKSLPDGFTYAEYARRGFFELLVAAAINFGIILFIGSFRDKVKNVKTLAIKVMLLVMAAATFIMIYSSYYRMRLYEQQYGYTYLRVFVYFCLLLGAALLVLAIIYIIKEKFKIVKFSLITIIIFYVCLNFINVDKMIAAKNIDRYLETGKIDMQYLKRLSADAYPEITRLLDVKDSSIAAEAKKYLQNSIEKFDEHGSWQEYNLSRYLAREAVYNALEK